MVNFERSGNSKLVVTDPGADDAGAILLVAPFTSSKGTKLYLDATYGNGPTIQTGKNLNGLHGFIQDHLLSTASITLGNGADRPLEAKEIWKLHDVEGAEDLDFIHGKDICGGLFSDSTPIKESSGVIYEDIRRNPQRVDVFSFGAVTEIAYILRNQDLIDKIDSVNVMGGAIFKPGNTPNGEANFRHDPNALTEVIKTCNSHNIPLRVVPLDLTHHPRLAYTKSRARQVEGDLKSKGKYNIARTMEGLVGPDSTYFKFYTSTTRQDNNPPYGKLKVKGSVIHDPIALLAGLYPDPMLWDFYKFSVGVNPNGEIRIANEPHMRPVGTIEAVMEIKDTAAYWELVSGLLSKYD